MRRLVSGLGVSGLALAVAGCVATTIVMKNPTTGQVIVCTRHYDQAMNAAVACADALKRDGWIELGRDVQP